jgi:hypothetical protein
MTMAEIIVLARRLNKKINVPLIKDSKEEKILIKIVLEIDTFIYNHMPNEFYDLIRSLDEGIDDEAKRLIIRLTHLANRKIDIPYIPEWMEHIAIRFIVAIIVNAARKHLNFDDAADKVDAISIPEKEEAKDEELEGLIV